MLKNEKGQSRESMLIAENSSLVENVVLNVHCVACRVALLKSIRPINGVCVFLFKICFIPKI